MIFIFASGGSVGLKVLVDDGTSPFRGRIAGNDSVNRKIRYSGQWPAGIGSRLEWSGARPLGRRLVGARGLFAGFRA